MLLLVCGACRQAPEEPLDPLFTPTGAIGAKMDGIDFYVHERGVLYGRIPARGCLARWRKLKEEAVKVGKWPVLIIDGEVLKGQGFDERAGSPEQIVKDSAPFDREDWLESSRLALAEEQQEVDKELGEKLDHSYFQPRPEGVVPVGVRLPLTDQGLSWTRPDRDILVALLPTPDSWKVYAYFPVGDWNSYHNPEFNLAVLRSWHERFGTEVVVMTNDRLVLESPWLIEDPREACEVAEELMFFCRDLVDASPDEDATALANEIRQNKAWSFWWD